MAADHVRENREPTEQQSLNRKSPDRLILIAFFLVVVLAGSNAVAVRFSNVELPPFWGASIRFGIAALLLFVLALAQRLVLPRGRALAGATLFGVLGIGLSYAFIYWGLLQVQAGLAQIVLALVPLLTFLLALVHGLESFRWRGLLGAALAVAGIAFAFGQQLGLGVPLASLLALVMAAICLAESSIVAKLLPGRHPVTTNAVAMGTGAVILLAISLIARERWVVPSQPATWLALTYLALVGSVAVFVLFLFVLGRWSASATSYLFVLSPFVTVVVAAWLLHERVTPLSVLGGALVLAGVWIGALALPTSAGRRGHGLEAPSKHPGEGP